MKVRRYDGIEDFEITLDNPVVTKYDKNRNETLTKGKCSICNSCWLNVNHEGNYYCSSGGPFKGYIS